LVCFFDHSNRLVWGLGYNIVVVPLAAGVFYGLIKVMIPPWIAGTSEIVSSISVMISSLLLRLYKKPKL